MRADQWAPQFSTPAQHVDLMLWRARGTRSHLGRRYWVNSLLTGKRMRRWRTPEILCIRNFTFQMRARAIDTIKKLRGCPTHRRKTNRVLKITHIYRKGARSIPRSNFTHRAKCVISCQSIILWISASPLGGGNNEAVSRSPRRLRAGRCRLDSPVRLRPREPIHESRGRVNRGGSPGEFPAPSQNPM